MYCGIAKMTDDRGLGGMPLYAHLERIARGLAARGIGPLDPIPPAELLTLDQWHYHGADAVRAAAGFLALGPGSRVLDVGAGIGGPARLLAQLTGCRVTALELQPALHALGADLTRRCGLADRVDHVCGDALAVELPAGGFDAVVSFMALLHVPERARLLRRLAEALAPGGQGYVEDLCQRAPFAARERHALRTVVHGVTVTDIAAYAAELAAAGFAEIVVTDLAADWASHAAARLAAWRADRAAYAAVHGEGAWAALERHYAGIDRLYRGGSLGGVRLTARR